MGPIFGINSMNNMQSIHDVNTFLNGVTNSIYLSSAIEVIWVIATFIVINYILNNKLNLE